MRIVHAGQLFLLCGVISALLPAVEAVAAINAYMTIKGTKQGAIKGEGMSDTIQLVGVARDTPTAPGVAAGRRMHTTITITKKIDMASPKLFQASSTHEMLSEVVIGFEGGGPGSEKEAQKIVLTNATILSVRKAGGNEQITFDYQGISVTYAKGGTTMADDWMVPN